MILLIGTPSEQPMSFHVNRLDELRAEYLLLDPLLFAGINLKFNKGSLLNEGRLFYRGKAYALESFESIYTRNVDFVSALSHVGLDHQNLKEHAQALNHRFSHWLDSTNAVLVNRAVNASTNFSKPQQLQSVKNCGFLVPDTLITNEPSKAVEFYNRHERVIFKSISSERSIVKILGEADMERMDALSAFPVQFQKFIDGFHVRVHAVGDQIFATKIESQVVDYRYSSQDEGPENSYSDFHLPEEIKAKCFNLNQSLGLHFSGIDLKIDSGGNCYCFEVNTSPAYSFYEGKSQQPISLALAKFLSNPPRVSKSIPEQYRFDFY